MKDENNGYIMSEFIGLRANLYTYTVPDAPKPKDKLIKKVTSVKESVLNKITFDDCKKCLIDNDTLKHNQHII